MKRFNSNRDNLSKYKLLSVRKNIKFIFSLTHYDYSMGRLNGFIFGLVASNVITFSTYNRLEKLFQKIENNQIISLRK